VLRDQASAEESLLEESHEEEHTADDSIQSQGEVSIENNSLSFQATGSDAYADDSHGTFGAPAMPALVDLHGQLLDNDHPINTNSEFSEYHTEAFVAAEVEDGIEESSFGEPLHYQHAEGDAQIPLEESQNEHRDAYNDDNDKDHEVDGADVTLDSVQSTDEPPPSGLADKNANAAEQHQEGQSVTQETLEQANAQQKPQDLSSQDNSQAGNKDEKIPVPTTSNSTTNSDIQRATRFNGNDRNNDRGRHLIQPPFFSFDVPYSIA
jgi:hypothetical protein